MVHKQKSQIIERYPELTVMIKVEDENLKMVFLNMFQKVKENMTMIRRKMDKEDVKVTHRELLRNEENSK